SPVNMDLYDSGYFPRILLFILYGLYDAMYQAVQSAGGAISWRIDAVGTSYLIQLIICWALLAISIPFAFPVVLNLKETNYDSKNIDEKVVTTNKSEIPA
ncbi:15740_t:CDS:2, partial [Dentiscutata heterogama]